jgi:CHAT domain-containing protein
LPPAGELAKARFVHLATHGVLGLDRGEPPALVLAQTGTTGAADEYGLDDGFLSLPEVSALRLNADLVVLSACRTGQGRMHNGEGVSSLARVFQYAGTRGVICSLWSVDDAATSLLMQEMYRQLEKGRGTAEALCQAKRKLIDDDYPPLFWAPFVLHGR